MQQATQSVWVCVNGDTPVKISIDFNSSISSLAQAVITIERLTCPPSKLKVTMGAPILFFFDISDRIFVSCRSFEEHWSKWRLKEKKKTKFRNLATIWIQCQHCPALTTSKQHLASLLKPPLLLKVGIYCYSPFSSL